MVGQKAQGWSRSARLALMMQVAEKCRIADHLRVGRCERRPRPASIAARSFGSALGTDMLARRSSSSPAVRQGLGSSRKITSEKLSPGSLSFLSRAWASVLSVIIIEGIYTKHGRTAANLQAEVFVAQAEALDKQQHHASRADEDNATTGKQWVRAWEEA